MSAYISKKKGMTIRDLVTTGVFSALFFVFMLIGTIFFAPNPVLTYLTPMGAALLTGPVFLLLVAKTAKPGAITILGVVMGLLLFVTGMFWLWAIACVVMGILADLIAGAGKYRSRILNSLSFMFFSLNPMGSYIMLLINQQAYVDYLVNKGTEQAYMETMLTTYQGWLIPAMFAGTLVCAFLSAILGHYLLRKQFEKAGVTP